MTHLAQAEALNKNATHPAAGAIHAIIEHLKEQDELIARLQKAVEYLESENSLNRPLT